MSNPKNYVDRDYNERDAQYWLSRILDDVREGYEDMEYDDGVDRDLSLQHIFSTIHYRKDLEGFEDLIEAIRNEMPQNLLENDLTIEFIGNTNLLLYIYRKFLPRFEAIWRERGVYERVMQDRIMDGWV